MRRRRMGLWAALGLLVAALSVVAAGCGGGSDSSSASTEIEGLGSTLEDIQANAKDEGEVNLVIWAGYADKSWADQFTQETGCKVNTHDGASSDDMVDLVSTGAYDGVSASGDATLRLIAKGDVAPVNFDLIPNYADVYEGLKGQSYNTVDGVGYGVPHGRGVNDMIFNNTVLPKDSDSWEPIWPGTDYKGKLSIYDNQIFIADAAIYLKATQPDLGIDESVRARRGPVQRCDRPLEAAAAEHRQVLGRRHVRGSGDDVQVGRDGGRHHLAVSGQPHGRREAAADGDRARPQGGNDRVVGHVDDLLEGRASELHVPLDELHHLAGCER